MGIARFGACVNRPDRSGAVRRPTRSSVEDRILRTGPSYRREANPPVFRFTATAQRVSDQEAQWSESFYPVGSGRRLPRTKHRGRTNVARFGATRFRSAVRSRTTGGMFGTDRRDRSQSGNERLRASGRSGSGRNTLREREDIAEKLQDRRVNIPEKPDARSLREGRHARRENGRHGIRMPADRKQNRDSSPTRLPSRSRPCGP